MRRCKTIILFYKGEKGIQMSYIVHTAILILVLVKQHDACELKKLNAGICF